MIKKFNNILWASILTCIAMGLLAENAIAAQQYRGLCSYVKIEIQQELALERIGFLATLEITNNEGDAGITDFSATLTFEYQALADDGSVVDASDMFFVQPPELSGINAIDGTGILQPGETGSIQWFIIPKISAGGDSIDGIQYNVGAQLGGSIYGAEISPEVLAVIPDTITVKPDPQLDITYFQPRDVDGDDPFTADIVESPIPFTLGVLVKNVGYGRARNIRISSEQPRIVENLQGLLVIPQLLGARVDDEPTDNASLTVNLGSIEPGKCRKGAWDMITSLSGEFTEFKASYTHASELGGRDTSIIKDINAYFMVHEVLNDQPGRDNLLDFLAETNGDGEEMIPDTLYESDCNTVPVNSLADIELLDYSGLSATVRVGADFENWVFIRLDDPAQAKYDIESVVRSDGKVLNPNNYWTNIRYQKPSNEKLTYLNIFDFVALGEYEYIVTYLPVDTDNDPPVTQLHFSGEYQEISGRFYVLPETQLFFIADDANPVGIYYKLDDAPDFLPAYPFTIPDAGEHTLEFYSTDSVGNEETHQIVTVVVSDTYPDIINLSSDTDELFIAGDALSVRPDSATISFSGVMTAASLDANVEIYSGVYGWATVSGVPSSPTTRTDTTLTVGGENVDFYQYRMGNGSWSNEFSVTQPIQLTGLSPGTVDITVLGRSQYGNYPADVDAVTVSWVVAATAPITVSGTPPTPGLSQDASLVVSGSDYYCYRVDGGYYSPNANIADPINLTRLSEMEHVVEVLARSTQSEACPGDVAGTAVRWTLNRQYGFNFPDANKVFQTSLGEVNDTPAEFTWDGGDDNGSVVSPGWYTVKITVQDGLGRSASVVELLHVGDMLADEVVLSGAGNVREVYVFGKWVVWQDQRNGNWDIFARDISNKTALTVTVANNNFNQERPRTDGKFIVWEDRQADGTWDVWAKQLDSAEPIFAITSTPDFDERKPVVYWPWVIYQARAVASQGDPWQIMAYNMIDTTTTPLDTTTQDQLDPSIYKRCVVWQDFRDAGYGEIYLKDLVTGQISRITDSPGGQYYPVVFDQWIVWADNRNTQFDLYGYNLQRNAEIRLTDTPENETRPYLSGKWVVYEEGGGTNVNIRILHLANLASIQLTNVDSEKEKPGYSFGQLVWNDRRSGHWQLMVGEIPALQPVFNNQNTVAVTGGMVTGLGDSHTLLKQWNNQAGVTAITRYTSLIPQPAADTVTWNNGQPVGTNFALEKGSFLWVKFDSTKILDLGQNVCAPVSLSVGSNVFSYSCFPSHPEGYSAYKLIREIGVANINAIRTINSETGRWQVASVVDGRIVGEDFTIPRIAVLMLDMNLPVASWKPGEVEP